VAPPPALAAPGAAPAPALAAAPAPQRRRRRARGARSWARPCLVAADCGGNGWCEYCSWVLSHEDPRVSPLNSTTQAGGDEWPY